MKTEDRIRILQLLPRGAEVRFTIRGKGDIRNSKLAFAGPFYKRADLINEMSVDYNCFGIGGCYILKYEDLTCDAVEVANLLTPSDTPVYDRLKKFAADNLPF